MGINQRSLYLDTNDGERIESGVNIERRRKVLNQGRRTILTLQNSPPLSMQNRPLHLKSRQKAGVKIRLLFRENHNIN